MAEWFRSIDWETVGGLALTLVIGGLLMYGLNCVRYDRKFPSRRNGYPSRLHKEHSKPKSRKR